MGAHFPGATGFGTYEVKYNPKPKPIINKNSRIYLPYQPMATINAVDAEWNPITEEQELFLNDKDKLRQDIDRLPELKTKVSDKISDIEKFLAAEVPKNIAKAKCITSSLFEAKLRWKQGGSRRIIFRDTDEGLWQGFSVKDRKFYQVDEYDFKDIVKLETNSDDNVFIQKWIGSPGGNLVKHVAETVPKMKEITQTEYRMLNGKKVYYDKVRIPNVKLDRTFTETPLEGMWFEKDGMKHKVDGFFNRVQLDMNFKGVEVKSYGAYGLPGVYCEIDLSAPRPIEFNVNEPFLMWIHRKGMDLPYFVGYITERDWEEIDW